ncbi:hypothetical protein VCSRO193_2533 [Vibrio cholerae]|nr:hypothetical protein VCSRO193_2533 [Vibrio cholerae]
MSWVNHLRNELMCPTSGVHFLILDNLNPQIKPASTRKDLLPIYSFNGKNLWLMKSNQGQLAGDSSRLSLWNDLRARERSLKLNKPLVSYDE